MFFDVTSSSESSNFERVKFFNFSLGQHMVRLLGNPRKVTTHFVRGQRSATVECLGDECPICENNKRIIVERPTDYSSASGWIPRSERHYINVLDRTPVKICPSCKEENKKDLSNKFPATCTNCSTMIVSEPETISNSIKVMNLSKTNAELINGFNLSILDINGEPIGVGNFDISFLVNKVNNKKIPTPIPVPDRNDQVNVQEEHFFNLENAVIKLYPDEIKSLLRGVSLKDIFLARKGSDLQTSLDVEVETLSSETKEQVMKLFG